MMGSTGDSVASLPAIIAALQQIGRQCREAGLANEADRLMRVSRQLAPFADSPPIPRKIGPFR